MILGVWVFVLEWGIIGYVVKIFEFFKIFNLINFLV